MKRIGWTVLFIGMLGLVPVTIPAAGETIRAFVSVAPLAYFVERIGGDRVTVSVMVEPGQNPHTYEPTPRQVAELSQTRIYFRVGVTFENLWMARIQQVNPSMKVVDLRDGVPLRTLESHHHEEGETEKHSHGEESNKDPHIWLNPRLVIQQATTITRALSEIDSAHQELYQKNLEAFEKDLQQVDQEIRNRLKNVRMHKFLVFHPSWGYYADAYGLQQISIEMEGKEPTAQQMTELFELVKKENIHTIFVQPQFNRRIAESIGKTIQGHVMTLDPLARDYLKNLREVTGKIAEALQ